MVTSINNMYLRTDDKHRASPGLGIRLPKDSSLCVSPLHRMSWWLPCKAVVTAVSLVTSSDYQAYSQAIPPFTASWLYFLVCFGDSQSDSILAVVNFTGVRGVKCRQNRSDFRSQWKTLQTAQEGPVCVETQEPDLGKVWENFGP